MKNKFNEPKKSGEVLVTLKLLEDTRAELKSTIISTGLEIRSEMNARFLKVDERFDGVDQRFEAVDRRFDSIDQRFEAIDQRFDSIDQRFETVDQRFDKMDQRFDKMDNNFGSLKDDFAQLKKDVIAIIDKHTHRISQDYYRILALTEQQKNENVYVLDEYQEVQRVQIDHEKRLCQLEDKDLSLP